MPLNLSHLEWTKTGRRYEVLDENDQPYDPPRYCWSGAIGDKNIEDGQGGYAPYLFDAESNTVEYGDNATSNKYGAYPP